MCNVYDAGLSLLQDLAQEILGQMVPVKLFTDGQTAWDAVTSMRAATEKHLLVDMFGLRESYRTGEMSNIAWINTAVNPADSMTKVNPTSYLLEVIKNNCFDHPIAQEVANGQV